MKLSFELKLEIYEKHLAGYSLNYLADEYHFRFLGQYRGADSDGRLDIMMDNFATFPKLIRKLEKKIQYKIKAEREYQRSHSRGELGVRVQSSKLSDTTAEEAIANVTLEEAFATGKVDKGLLKGIDNAAEYEADIRIINVMRMDFELLEEIIEDLERGERARILLLFWLPSWRNAL